MKAIKKMSSGKAQGSDAISAEIYKAGGQPMAREQTVWELFHSLWRKRMIMQEFNHTSVIHFYKRKGNPQVSYNCMGISLLSIAGKIFGKRPTELRS